MSEQRCVLDVFRPMETGAEEMLKEYAALVADRLGFGASYLSFSIGDGAQPVVSLLKVGGELADEIFANDGERLKEIAAQPDNNNTLGIRGFMTLWGWDLPEHKGDLRIKSRKPVVELADGLAKRGFASPVATPELWGSLKGAIDFSRHGTTLPKGIRIGVQRNTIRNLELVAPSNRRDAPFKDDFIDQRNKLNMAMPDIALGPIEVRYTPVDESRKIADPGYLT